MPLADFREIARSAGDTQTNWSPLDTDQQIGITNGPLAIVVSLIVVTAAWSTLYAYGRLRRVPGGHDPVLQLISTKSGYASLSQLQIMLWTFVVGGCAVYVMVLSGNLIEISNGTLTLLGIAGVSTLGSKLSDGTNAPATSPASVAPQQIVQGLRADTPASATEVRLTWAPTHRQTSVGSIFRPIPRCRHSERPLGGSGGRPLGPRDARGQPKSVDQL